MAQALTATQMETLRRARDGRLGCAENPLPGELREALLLHALGLLERGRYALEFRISVFGLAYLDEAERELAAPAAAARPAGGDCP